MDIKTFKIFTFGCKTNQYESEAIIRLLLNAGLTESEQDADLFIVNGCAVTEAASKEVKKLVTNLLSNHPKSKIVFTGCLAPKDAAFLQNVVTIIPNDRKSTLVSEILGISCDGFYIDKFHNHTRAFVKIQDGCNNFCSYCIVPYTRGRSKSRTIPDVIKEVEKITQNGHQEIVLTGIDIGSFNDDGKTLADLILALENIEALQRLRISSINPNNITDELLQAIDSSKKICPSLHISLQSGSNAILKKMNRKYTKETFLRKVRAIKQLNSDFTFTTDIIVGFPGETNEDFIQSLKVIDEVRFAKTHVFPFSPREGTQAFELKDIVPSKVVFERKKLMLEKTKAIASDVRKSFLGRTFDVLIESRTEKDNFFIGYTPNLLPIVIRSDLTPGSICEVKIMENGKNELYGERCVSK